MNTMVYSVHYFDTKSTEFSAFQATAESGAGLSFLYDRDGKRKYLTMDERQAFLDVAKREALPEVYTFCSVLAHTGARISEALALGPSRIDLTANAVVLECLKKRRTGVYRAVPIPRTLIDELDAVHAVRKTQHAQSQTAERLWPWRRTTAWKLVTDFMRRAGIQGSQAMPKGLRHGLAVTALQSGVPLNIVSRWLGHARLGTTAIYANAVGDEERALAERFWDTF